MRLLLFLLLFSLNISAQNIGGIQLFNPKTNDETGVLLPGEKLVLRFDDLANKSKIYYYTIKHLNRDFEEDDLFFTEYAEGSMNAQIPTYTASFNTLQPYTHYELQFPNENLRPKISGNFKLIVYENSENNPIITKYFSVAEQKADIGLKVSRNLDTRGNLNQRVEVLASGGPELIASLGNSATLTVVQNNNRNIQLSGIKSTGMQSNNSYIFQDMNMIFPGNSEFFYFDNKNITSPFDMVAEIRQSDRTYHTILHPVYTSPMQYLSNPDVNGAYYFRRNDLGIERDADKEGDYSWVYFSLDSEKTDKEIYVLGGFNDYIPSKENQMYYDENSKKYIAKIYLKQGFYNYILATKNHDGTLNFGEINGNFWQTENLYQAYLYYTPFGKNYDALVGYGEYRTPVR